MNDDDDDGDDYYVYKNENGSGERLARNQPKQHHKQQVSDRNNQCIRHQPTTHTQQK